MKWPQVLPCNPVPSWPSNSVCLRGKKGLQCGFNPTQPLLSFSGFVTYHLDPHLTHLHVTSSSPCSRCNFISRRARLQYLCHGSLLALLWALTHPCIPLFSVFPLLVIPYPPPVQHKNKTKTEPERSSSNLPPRLMIWVWANTSGKASTAVMRCLAASYSLSSFSKNPVLLASRVPHQQGGCNCRYIAVGRQPKPGWSGRCKWHWWRAERKLSGAWDGCGMQRRTLGRLSHGFTQ